MPLPEAAGYEILSSGPGGEAGGLWFLTVHIPEGSPLFAGHFPGHPILPGVVHLALVTRALSAWQGRAIALAGVRSWKLRRPVGPGETLTVRLSGGGEDAGSSSVGFILEKEGEAVSRGTVTWR
jgi:3-hydroxymyristoyl/3-hydroxydecanoyl-(acyl carrier protein) dehydratase